MFAFRAEQSRAEQSRAEKSREEKRREEKRIKYFRLTLGLIYPIVILLLSFGVFVANYSDLPSRITIHFNTSRAPTTSLPTSIFGCAILSMLVLTVLACVSVAFSKHPYILHNYKKVAGYGGFFSAVALGFIFGAIAIHSGLDNWQEATGPGWLIAIPIILGFIGGFFTEFLAKSIHGQEQTI